MLNFAPLVPSIDSQGVCWKSKMNESYAKLLILCHDGQGLLTVVSLQKKTIGDSDAEDMFQLCGTTRSKCRMLAGSSRAFTCGVVRVVVCQPVVLAARRLKTEAIHHESCVGHPLDVLHLLCHDMRGQSNKLTRRSPPSIVLSQCCRRACYVRSFTH